VIFPLPVICFYFGIFSGACNEEHEKSKMKKQYFEKRNKKS